MYIVLVVLERVIKKVVAGADIAEVCAYGDGEINGEVLCVNYIF
jgi:hypothetical protein